MTTNNYLKSVQQQFEYYKTLGEKAFVQVSEEGAHWKFNKESNSIATVINHLVGNMLSRWTNFGNEDGEKEWRQRDQEFEEHEKSKIKLFEDWETGWKCLFDALSKINEEDLQKIVYIRNQGHTVTEAINRQLGHYSYHIGQLVFIAKMLKKEKWQTLSIGINKSNNYNKIKFSKTKARKHFTEED